MPKKKSRNNPGAKGQKDDSKPSTPMEVMFGKTLLTNASGSTDSTTKLLSKGAKKGLVAIYFAAGDDKTCQEFTPTLIDFYKAVSPDEIEIVYVSSDKNATEFNSYYGQMPWLSMLVSDEVIANKNSLARTLQINAIPTLVVLDAATGDFVTKDGVAKIREADKTSYKQVLAEWKAIKPVAIEQGVKIAASKDLTVKAFFKTLLRQIIIIFILMTVGSLVMRHGKSVLMQLTGQSAKPASSAPSGNTEL